MGRGGPGRGQGCKPGSTRPERRIGVASAYVMVREEIKAQAKREHRPDNSAIETYMLAFAVDHPDKVSIHGDKTVDGIIDAILAGEIVHIRDIVKINDEEHFHRYCETQGKLRSKGEREMMKVLEQE